MNEGGSYIMQLNCASGACPSNSGNGQFGGVGALFIDGSGNIWAGTRAITGCRSSTAAAAT